MCDFNIAYGLGVYVLTALVVLPVSRRHSAKCVWMALTPGLNLVLAYKMADDNRYLLWLFAPYGYFVWLAMLWLMSKGY